MAAAASSTATARMTACSAKNWRAAVETRLHLLEQVPVVAAHFQLAGEIAQLEHLPAAQVARDFGDGVDPHQGGTVDAPELVRIQFVRQFLERLADQELGGGGLHAGVFVFGLEEQDLAGADHAQAAADLGLDPAQVVRLGGGAALLEQRAQLEQLRADVLRRLGQALAHPLAGGVQPRRGHRL